MPNTHVNSPKNGEKQQDPHKPEFEIPPASHKLSYKFILDSMKEQMLEESLRESILDNAQEEVVDPAEAIVRNEPVEQNEQAELFEHQGGVLAEETPTEPNPEGFPNEPQMDLAEIEEVSEPVTIPDVEKSLPEGKRYFRIGEAAQVVGVEAHVLRYWESEFPPVRPIKSRSGQRVYARKDVVALLQIKHLLYSERFSVKGAKKKLQEHRRQIKEIVTQRNTAPNTVLLRELAKLAKQVIHAAKKDQGL